MLIERMRLVYQGNKLNLLINHISSSVSFRMAIDW